MTRLINFIRRLYTRIWLYFHWRRSIDSAPDEYVKAMEKEGRGKRL